MIVGDEWQQAKNRIRSTSRAGDALARLSPHRTHESNWLKALLCALGLHRWYSPEPHRLGSTTGHPVLPLVPCG